MAARILRAIVIVKDSDEDEKMENRDKEEEEGRQSARQRWPGVSALRLSFHTRPATVEILHSRSSYHSSNSTSAREDNLQHPLARL